ncbi:hypothetical protein NY78_3246 [Desulfovibrio sp. TomC]|nr:hypothetical protein NY78_3246 [Desulfovibrio sp. TomC]
MDFSTKPNGDHDRTAGPRSRTAHCLLPRGWEQWPRRAWGFVSVTTPDNAREAFFLS